MASSSTSAISTPANVSDGGPGTVVFEALKERFAKKYREKAKSFKESFFDFETERFGSQSSKDEFNWLIYAGYVNPAAGMQLKEAANILYSAQVKYDYEENLMSAVVPLDVLGYLLIGPTELFRQLKDNALDCERPDPLYFKPGSSQEALCQSVDTLGSRLAKILEGLSVSLSSDITPSADTTAMCNWWETINPDGAYTAIAIIVADLGPLSDQLWRIYENRKAEAKGSAASTGLRRRRPADAVNADQVQDAVTNLPATWESFMLETFDNSVSWIQRINPLVTQDTLWVITFISITVSGAIAGYSIALKIQTTPKIFDDPNFWSLLGQVVTQWLSLYVTVLPVLRKNVERRTIWFPICLAISAAASLVAPIIYQFTWQGASMLAYLSAAMSLIVGVFLAGDIENTAAERELPGNDRSGKQRRRKRSYS